MIVSNRRATVGVALLVVLPGLVGASAPEEDKPFVPPPTWTAIGRDLKWCGAKGLWLLTLGYGKDVSFETVKGYCDPKKTSDGVLSMASLADATRACGLAPSANKCELEWLAATNLPALTLHNVPTQSNYESKNSPHYLVCLGRTADAVQVIDPFVPDQVIDMPTKDFLDTWTHDALLVADSPSKLPATAEWFIRLILLDLAAIAALVYMFRRKAGAKVPVALKGAAAALVLVVATGCGSSGASQASAASLTFDHNTFDAGVLQKGGDAAYEHAFPFTNLSGETVTIHDVKIGCSSCTRVEYPQEPIPPNGSGEVVMKVDLSLTNPLGVYPSQVLVRMNHAEGPAIRLSCFSYSLGEIEADPMKLEFGDVAAGTTAERDFVIRVPLAENEAEMGPPEISGLAGFIRVETLKSEVTTHQHSRAKGQDLRDQTLTIRATVEPKAPGEERFEDITLKFPGRAARLVVKTHERTVHPQFSIEPPNVYLGVVGSAGVRQKVSIRSKGKGPPPIKSAALVPARPGVRVWIEDNPKDGSERFLLIEAKPGASRVLSGEIRLTVDDSKFGTYPVRYVGYLN